MLASYGLGLNSPRLLHCNQKAHQPHSCKKATSLHTLPSISAKRCWKIAYPVARSRSGKQKTAVGDLPHPDCSEETVALYKKLWTPTALTAEHLQNATYPDSGPLDCHELSGCSKSPSRLCKTTATMPWAPKRQQQLQKAPQDLQKCFLLTFCCVKASDVMQQQNRVC